MGLTLDPSELLLRLFKYLLEGFVVSAAAFFLLPKNRLGFREIITLGLVAAATFSVLDLFAPTIGSSVRLGAGMGIGFNLVGFPATPVV